MFNLFVIILINTYFYAFLQILSDNEINGKPGDLMISRTNVSLKALPDYFINNHIQIRCQAIISVENHNVITLPIQRNSTPTHSSTKFGYQNDALISGIFVFNFFSYI